MDDKHSSLLQFAAPLLPIGLAVLGGVVRQLRREDCNIRTLVIAALTATFTGAVVQFGIADLEMAESIKGAIIGMSGWAGADLLKVLAKRVCSAADAFGGGK